MVGVDYSEIKKAGGSQPIGTNNLTTSVDDGKSETLTHRSHSSSNSIKSKHKKKGKKMDGSDSFICQFVTPQRDEKHNKRKRI